MQKSLIKQFFKRINGGPFAVTYWDGQTEIYGSAEKKEPIVRLVIKEKLNLPEMLCEPEVRFGEAYMENKIDFEGDLRDVFQVLHQLLFSKGLHNELPLTREYIYQEN